MCSFCHWELTQLIDRVVLFLELPPFASGADNSSQSKVFNIGGIGQGSVKPVASNKHNNVNKETESTTGGAA